MARKKKEKMQDNSSAEVAIINNIVDKRWLSDAWNVAVESKRKLLKDWKTIRNYFLGEHWKNSKLPKYVRKYAVNFIFMYADSLTARLTDSRPIVKYIPRIPSPSPQVSSLARNLDYLFEYLWEYNRGQQVIYETVMNQILYGTGIIKVYFDVNDMEVKFSSVSPFEIFVDPSATSIENARYVIHATLLTPEEIAWRYNLPIEQVKGLKNGKDILSVDIDKAVMLDDKKRFIGGGNRILVREYWIRDPAIAITKDGLARKVLPNGRIITMIGNQVIDDKPNPYGVFPFAFFYDVKLSNDFWGYPALRNLVESQDFYNFLLSMVHRYLNLKADPTVEVDARAGFKEEEVALIPGTTFTSPIPNAIRPIDVAGMPPEVFSLQSLVKQEMDAIIGVYDVTMGRRPRSVTSAQAIATLEHLSQTRLRPKERNIEEGIRRLGRIFLEIIKVAYPPQKIFTKFSLYEVPQTIVLDISLLQKADIDFDIRVIAGTGLSSTPNAIISDLISLAQTGMIPPQTLFMFLRQVYPRYFLDFPIQESKINNGGANNGGTGNQNNSGNTGNAGNTGNTGG